ncbi:hypothetical protein MKW94_026539 [Papaver nudicaule]|uniref:Uncharacterized protein n=1 Tax=Papaver nudicaule TaxID=74823 RepID=A0AA41VYS8_PAPNU|nr:hypothetical protein [Papaver nudicaule]
MVEKRKEGMGGGGGNKEGGGDNQKKMFVGVIWNCAAEIKILLTALFFLCLTITLLQYFLPSRFSLSPSDLRLSVSSVAKLSNSEPPSLVLSPPPLPSPPPPPLSLKQDEILENGVVKRAFNPFGSAAYNFKQMGSYRGGLNSFAIIGLSSKPLHVYGKPHDQCEWIPLSKNQSAETVSTTSITTTGYKILPYWGYGRVYTVVVVNCTFKDEPVIPVGGKLIFYASTGAGGGFGEDGGVFDAPQKYNYLYCGSSLYGNLSPQKVREWIAYHVKLFGEKSHFVIHDAAKLMLNFILHKICSRFTIEKPGYVPVNTGICGVEEKGKLSRKQQKGSFCHVPFYLLLTMNIHGGKIDGNFHLRNVLK